MKNVCQLIKDGNPIRTDLNSLCRAYYAWNVQLSVLVFIIGY